MRATDDAPDTTAEQPWQHTQDQLTRIRTRTLAEAGDAIAAIDTCLTTLDTLRKDLTHRPWTRSPSPRVPPVTGAETVTRHATATSKPVV
ncbi:hypothetical protein GCM10018781_76670 [Kitasatospora indigofera]|uniref:Uncharacterized protein n=1 Tax=Kitasatospora indigofera TaxID=67307 RepID=A0A919D7J6_9ACTN|nr:MULTISPECIES: hypothetical protein [Kitasatospora]MDQ0305848.1 hypothetical protein [Kitasatospora herbaricolor]GHE25334.1 hypothetical protein GCM10018781_76670 [Kitasatospora indigofera]